MAAPVGRRLWKGQAVDGTMARAVQRGSTGAQPASGWKGQTPGERGPSKGARQAGEAGQG